MNLGNNNLNFYIILSLLLVTQVSYSIDAYKCVVHDSAGVTDDGKLASTEFTKMYHNKEFVVDKVTGRITGGLSNSNSYGQPQVVDYGSKDQAFKVITIYKPFTRVAYLSILEFNKSVEKPFIFVDSSSTYTGLCSPY